MAAQDPLRDTEWCTPPEQLTLSHDLIHVWRVRLDVAQSHLARLYDTLAPDEQARATRFHHSRDRDHFIAARGTLRGILGRYLDTAPKQVCFAYGPHGKPMLHQSTAAHIPIINFNLAHAHGLALCAIACGRNVGVDIEFLRPALAESRIAEQFFSAGEVASLLSLPAAERPLAFFRCWTRKEAFIKARGDGLAFPLNRFEVSLAPDEPPALHNVADTPDEAERWSLCELIPSLNYVAALVVEGHGWRPYTWDWAYQAGHS